MLVVVQYFVTIFNKEIKMKQVKSKRKTNGLLVFSICLLVVAIITSLTFALFTDYKRSETQITFGKIQIDAGKTIVNTNVANLLPNSPVLSDKVVVAKDVFSESYILRAKHSFTLGESVTSPENFQTYLDILSGASFEKVDAYGSPVYADENWYSYDQASNTYTQLYIQETPAQNAKYQVAHITNTPDPTGVTFYSDKNGSPFSGTAYLKVSDNRYYTGTAQVLYSGADTIATAALASGTLYSDSTAQTTFSGTVYTYNNQCYQITDTATALYVVDTPATEATYAPATTENVPTGKDVTFYTLDAEGSNYSEATGVTAVRQPEMGNGFILTTQAVDASGNIWASVYDATTGAYTSSIVDLDGNTTQDTVKEGYAQNYRWFYLDGYFYLCEWFADGNQTDLADTVRIKNVERAELANPTVTLDKEYNLTTEAGRAGLLDYFDNVLTVTPSGAAAGTLTSFKTALDTAKTNYTDAVSAFNTAKNNYTTAYGNTIKALPALKSAQANVSLTGTNLETYNTFNDALMIYLNSNDPDATFTADNTTLSGLGDANVNTYLTQVATITDLKNTELGLLTIRNTNAKAVDSALGAFNQALANYSEARDLVAKEMKEYQELYVFALGGDEYNTIPTDLYQLEDYAQYNTEFVLNLEFNAVQSENLRLADSDTDLDLAQTTVANLVQFFAAE